jgi:8-oxo-dGTP pyrophosphatase MutT (NUDIX family)
VALASALNDFEARSEALAPVLAALAAAGEIDGWRNEAYPVMENWGDAPLLTMERAACPRFGVRAWGVHLNGYAWRGGDLYLWIATRARNKPSYPGMLDNMVAGGQPHGIGPRDNMVKECAEEAGIPADIAARLQGVGALSYCHQTEDGVKPDQIFCYDLELPADFAPVNQDGEVEKFELWPIQEVAARVRDGFDFKFNCNLVLIDFLIRHAIITPENEPDYMALNRGLRRWD